MSIRPCLPGARLSLHLRRERAVCLACADLPGVSAYAWEGVRTCISIYTSAPVHTYMHTYIQSFVDLRVCNIYTCICVWCQCDYILYMHSYPFSLQSYECGVVRFHRHVHLLSAAWCVASFSSSLDMRKHVWGCICSTPEDVYVYGLGWSYVCSIFSRVVC